MSSQLRLANFWGKRRANTSNVWDHFGFKCNEEGVIIDRSKATCKYCFIEINMQEGTLQTYPVTTPIIMEVR